MFCHIYARFMSYGYSIDLRERVVSYIQDGHTQKEASTVFKLPRQTIYNWLRLKVETGHLRMRRSGKHSSLKLGKEALHQAVDRYPDHYLWELAALFQVSPSGIYRALKRYKITRKKRRSSLRKEMRPSVRSL